MQLSSLLVLLGTTIAMAAPMDHRLEEIQCRCLTYSTDTRPTPCTYMESQRLDWQTANTLASDYNLKIQFASQDTISNILAIHRPLPSSVLETVDRGEVMERAEEGLMQRENKIVCGFGDEVRSLGHQDRSMEPECHFVGYVVGALMMLVALYIFAEYIWSRYDFHPSRIETFTHHDLDSSRKAASSWMVTRRLSRPTSQKTQVPKYPRRSRGHARYSGTLMIDLYDKSKTNHRHCPSKASCCTYQPPTTGRQWRTCGTTTSITMRQGPSLEDTLAMGAHLRHKTPSSATSSV
jgi:hypothetical protein